MVATRFSQAQCVGTHRPGRKLVCDIGAIEGVAVEIQHHPAATAGAVEGAALDGRDI